MATTEKELVSRATRGDQQAFGVLASRHGPRLLRALIPMVKTPQDAEDLVQEAFIKALRKLPDFRGESSFGTWLHRIAYNLAYDLARKKREQPMAAEDLEGLSGSESFAAIDRIADRTVLVQAMRKLSREHQVVLVLRHGEGLSLREIAETLEIPEGTVKSRLYNGYRMIKDGLYKPREEM